jgi:hypothetical protein
MDWTLHPEIGLPHPQYAYTTAARITKRGSRFNHEKNPTGKDVKKIYIHRKPFNQIQIQVLNPFCETTFS